MRKQTRPLTLWALIGCLLFLSLSGFAGGIAMLVDPSGAILSLPPDLLAKLPLETFLLPGLYLVVVYGLLAPVIAYALWKRAPWAWTAVVILSFILLGWILGQLLLWGSPHIIQVVYLILSLVMIFLSLVPATWEDQQQRLAI